MGLYEDLLQNHNAKLIAGGAAQNTARGAQVRLLPQFYARTVVLDRNTDNYYSIVYPPRRLCSLYWLHRQRQIWQAPGRYLQTSWPPSGIPLR